MKIRIKGKIRDTDGVKRVRMFLDSIKVEKDPEFYTVSELSKAACVSSANLKSNIAPKMKEEGYCLMYNGALIFSNPKNVTKAKRHAKIETD